MPHAFTLSLAWGFVVAIAVALVNVFPSHRLFETVRDRHGWPLIGVVREPSHYNVGELVPFLDSKVKHVEPAYLIVDGLIGLGLVAASVFAMQRILVREPFPITVRMSLWQMICGVSFFGLVLGLFRSLVVSFLLLHLPILIVYWSFVVIFLAVVDRRVRVHT